MKTDGNMIGLVIESGAGVGFETRSLRVGFGSVIEKSFDQG